jgi:hypothetical protein
MWNEYPSEDIADLAGKSLVYDDSCAVLRELVMSGSKKVSSLTDLIPESEEMYHNDVDCDSYDPDGLNKWLVSLRAYKAGEVKSVDSTSLGNYLSGDPYSCPGKQPW